MRPGGAGYAVRYQAEPGNEGTRKSKLQNAFARGVHRERVGLQLIELQEISCTHF